MKGILFAPFQIIHKEAEKYLAQDRNMRHSTCHFFLQIDKELMMSIF